MTQKKEVYDFLCEIYGRTKWPYIRIDVIKDKFGDGSIDTLNALREEGKIKKRQGFNRLLIEIL